MNKPITCILIFVLFTLLVLVRVFEGELFYDPYLAFFQNDYLYIDGPEQNVYKVIVHIVYRFIVNTVISLGILYLFFKDKNVVKFSAVVYIIAFVTLISLYVYFVMNPKQEDYYVFFNIRRFLIQPILLLLLLPAFYYYRLKE
jgi:exosortase F-associated protein